MRFRIRLAIALGVIVIFMTGTPGVVRAEPFDTLFAKARQLEQAGKRKEALEEYQRVAHEQKDPEAAAEARYQGGLYGLERYDGTAENRREGEDAAAQLWKEIYLNYPRTAAARKILDPQPGAAEGRYAALQQRLDKRNAADWKYKLMDGLVALTGRVPSFSYGFALILLAVVVKLITWPLTKKQYEGMRDMQRIQPLVKELQKKYKGVELQEKTMALYKEHNVNMFGGCVPLLIQMPFLLLVLAAVRVYEFVCDDPADARDRPGTAAAAGDHGAGHGRVLLHDVPELRLVLGLRALLADVQRAEHLAAV